VPKPEAILERLDWTVVRKLDGLLQGEYRSLFQGFGLDFAQLREYQYEDDIRYIDWNVTARLQVPYVRQYAEDREVTAWFLLDLSPSVDFGTAKTSKRNLLIDFVTVLTRLLTRRGNRAGAVLFAGGVDQIIPPLSSRVHVLRMIKALADRQAQKVTRQTDLRILLSGANNLIQRRSLIFLVSDFISVPGWERQLGLLARRHEVLAVRLIDPREVELPDIGGVFLQDAETGEQIYIDTHNRGFRERFRHLAERRDRQLQETFVRAGVDYLALSTDADLVKEIVRFAELRKRRRNNPALIGKKQLFSPQPRLSPGNKRVARAG
jgi:uncharacterized protein (DUF58 family)